MNRIANLIAVLGLFSLAPLTNAANTINVSVHDNGSQANGVSSLPSTSADGRFIAFASEASNLVDNDTNGVTDVFVRDRLNGITTRVSIDSSGTQVNGASSYPSISADGRYIAFESDATNLVPGDTNEMTDVFVRDRELGITTRVSVDSAGNEAFHGFSGPSFERGSINPFISRDGRYVAFTSTANNLTSVNNTYHDTFVHDRETGITTWARTPLIPGSYGLSANQLFKRRPPTPISADGRYVAFLYFYGAAICCPVIYVHDSQTGENVTLDVNTKDFDLSADGSYLVFASDFYNGLTGATDGIYDLFVQQVATGAIEKINVANVGDEAIGASLRPKISIEGRHVAFLSNANNLVSNDTNGLTDAFVRDRLTQTTSRVSVDALGNEANGASTDSAIGRDGRYVAFSSTATNLVAPDNNGFADVFLHDRGPINNPPVLSSVGNRSASEGITLTFTVAGTDPDSSNALTYGLDSGAPAGAAIDPATGVFTWLPGEETGGANYTVTVRVTDDGTPALFDSETFNITVNEINQAPVLTGVPSSATLDELTAYTFDANATDADQPAQALTFSLVGGAAGASIDPGTGVFSWTPAEGQGPGSYPFQIRVSDGLIATQSAINLTVQEKNLPPVLGSIGNRQVSAETQLTFTATATDPDLPANALTYSLAGAPAGASINPTTGVFMWTPTKRQIATYTLTIRVADNGSPSLNDSEVITVVVTKKSSR